MGSSKLTPLQHDVPIVYENGTPTPYFIQLLQQWREENLTDVNDLESVIAEIETLKSRTTKFFVVGPPTADEILAIVPFTETVAFAANFAGSRGVCLTNPTAAATLRIFNGITEIGAVAVSVAGAVSFTTVGGTAKTFAPGEYMLVQGQAAPDTTLANVGIALHGEI